ncbi:MAG: MBOAT family O-acyltransferase [Planctomycetota bacterium]
MLFNQIEFFVLFAAALACLLSIKSHGAQKNCLLVASIYFYGYWDWRFLSLLLFSTVFDYSAGRVLGRVTTPRTRRTIIVLSLIVNLGVLGFFKYFNFFVESLRAVVEPFGWQLGTLEIILPVGISFYTFQSLSYTLDVYRQKIEPCKSLRDFALYIAFFPQLVAGPIVRAADFLPQLKTPRTLSWEKAYSGYSLFVIGLFKKTIIADRLAPFVDEVFNNAGAYDAVTTWLAVVAYALQIYCDFSGYSDMAIGAARVIGYELTLNFNLPYIAHSIDNFWHRWHISLSTWLRDYLYIPLGGSRRGRVRTYVNLLLTMLLGGLWHGASWMFVLWGAIHGLALAVTRFIVSHPSFPATTGRAGKLCGWAITMLVVLVAWVFFRASSMETALLMLRQMFAPQDGFSWVAPYPLFAIAMMAVIHIVHALGRERWLRLEANTVWGPTVLFSMILLVVNFYPRGFTPFIYFQF